MDARVRALVMGVVHRPGLRMAKESAHGAAAGAGLHVVAGAEHAHGAGGVPRLIGGSDMQLHDLGPRDDGEWFRHSGLVVLHALGGRTRYEPPSRLGSPMIQRSPTSSSGPRYSVMIPIGRVFARAAPVRGCSPDGGPAPRERGPRATAHDLFADRPGGLEAVVQPPLQPDADPSPPPPPPAARRRAARAGRAARPRRARRPRPARYRSRPRR